MPNRITVGLNRFNTFLITRQLSRSVNYSAIVRTVINMSETKYTFDPKVLETRKSDHSIHPLLLSRTSPKHMTGEPITLAEMKPIFEAGRWAFSFYNQQPWRFIYAHRETDEWNKFFDLLWPLNQNWCDKAGALVVVVSKKKFIYKGKEVENPTHSFDVGAACMSMGLEACARGLVFHLMAGVEYEKVYEVFDIPKETYKVEAMLAIGKRDATKEERISDRIPIDEFLIEGDFNNNWK